MRIVILFIATLLLTFNSEAAIAQSDEGEVMMSSSEQIRELHDGVLLVRLPTKQNSIDALVKTGRNAQAEQLKAHTLEKNLELVTAMKEEFTFCPVYFFYSYDSEHILNGNIDSVQFLGPDLNVDSSIKLGDKKFYTAEITLISQDTSTKTKNLREGEKDDVDNKNEAKYYGGANMRFQALIIKDSQFNQLRRPFPYYSRTLNSFFLKKSLDDVVNTMDQKLWKFYGG